MITFEVDGRPQPWQRTNEHKGRRLTPARMRDAKQAIRTWAMVHCKEVWTGPVIMDLLFIFEPPESKRLERLGKLHTHKPDRDNLEKLVADALNGIAYKDDCQVAAGDVRKIWGDQAKTVITLKKGDET